MLHRGIHSGAGVLRQLGFRGFSTAPHLPAPAEASGPIDVQLLDQTAAHYMKVQSRRLYDTEVLRAEHQSVSWTFGSCRKAAEGLAHGLLQTGLRTGNRVLAIQSCCTAELVALQLACASVGAVMVTVPPVGLSAERLRYYLNEFQPTHLVARDWLTVPEGGKPRDQQEKPVHFKDVLYSVIPELSQTYPGQQFAWANSHEFFFLKRCIMTDVPATEDGLRLPASPLQRLQTWGPFSYHENRVHRIGMLLHPDDPIVAVEEPHPTVEDKTHIVFTHRNCVNAGNIFASVTGMREGSRIAVSPARHADTVGAVVAPWAALTAGATLVHLGEGLLNGEHVRQFLQQAAADEVEGFLLRRADLETIVQHTAGGKIPTPDSLKWVAVFEDAGGEQARSSAVGGQVPEATLRKAQELLGLDDVFVFAGTTESALMLSHKSIVRGDLGLVPHAEMKVVGDRGTTDAKTLAREVRGNLRLRGPHVTSLFYNNGGMLTELVDERGWCSTSRECVMAADGSWTLYGAQIY